MTIAALETFVDTLVVDFHSRRLAGLKKLKLKDILKRKNPYLYKAKNILTAGELITAILDARLSSSEETIFGNVLEQLAIFICKQTYVGAKSIKGGLDLDFERDGIRYIVDIKSGPNWANNQATKRMEDNFRKAAKIARTSNNRENIRAVCGCCYGKGISDKGGYLKICGQAFWELISGNGNLYLELIKPLEKSAKLKDEDFKEAYSAVVNKFTKEMLDTFSLESGAIDWEKLVKFNSGI